MLQTTKILRTAIFTLAALTSFLAILVVDGLFFPYITGKNFLFRGFVEIMLALYIPLAYLEPKYRPKYSIGVMAYSAFIGILFLADVFGVNVSNSLWSNFERMEGFVTHIHLYAFTLILIFIRLQDIEWKRFLNISLVANAYVVIASIADYLQIASANANGAQLGTRLQTLLGNSIYLSIYCAFGIFTILLLMARYKTKIVSLQGAVYSLLIVANLFVLWQTGTRGTVLGILAGLVSAVLWYGIRNFNNRKIRLGVIATVVAAIFAVAMFIANKDSAIIQNNPTLKRIAGISLQDQTVRSRVLIWQMSWQGVQERPLLGWGQENFIYVFAKDYNPEMFDQEQWFDRSHNVFFDWLIAAGALGLLAYLSLFVAIIFRLAKNPNSRFNTSEQAVIFGLLVTYFVHNIFVFDNTISYISFFTLFAYIFSSYSSNEVGTNKKQPKTKEINSMTASIVLAASTLVMCVVFYVVVYKPYTLNKSIFRMLSTGSTSTFNSLKNTAIDMTTPALYGNSEANEQLLTLTQAVVKSQAPEEYKKFFYDLTIQRYREEIQKDSKNPRPAVLFGGFAQNIEAYDIAIQSFQEGLARTPNKTLLWAEYARLLVAAGKVPEAEQAAAKAHELSHRSIKATQMYTAILLAQNKQDGALQAWQETIKANSYSQDSYVSAVGFLYARGGQSIVPSLVNDFVSKYPLQAEEFMQYIEKQKNATTTTAI